MLPAILRYRTLSLAGPYEQTPRLRWPTSATHLVACSMYFIRLAFCKGVAQQNKALPMTETKVVGETSPGNALTANLAQTEKPGAHRASPGSVAMLLSQLGVPTSECMGASRQQASMKLLRLIGENPQDANTVFEAGAVPLFVAWLRSDQVWAQEQALPLLALLHKSQRSRDAFLAAAAVPTLIPLMQSADLDIQTSAVLAVGKLAFQCQQGLEQVIAAGALPVLAHYCSADQFRLQACAAMACLSIADNTEVVHIPALVPAMVPMLKSKDLYLQEKGACIIARLTQLSQIYRNEIIAADVLPSLAVNLQSASTGLKHYAAVALAQLAADTEERLATVSAQISAAETLPALAAILQPADFGWSARSTAANLLTILASHSQQNKDSIVAAGIIPQLAALQGSHHCRLQIQAAAALGHIAAGNQANKDAVVASGAVPLLSALLVSGEHDGRSLAAHAFAWLAADSLQVTEDVIVTAGALPGLVGLMTIQQHEESHRAAFAIAHLAGSSQESKTAVIAAGALPPLIALLESDQLHLQIHAAAAAALVHLAAGSQRHQAAMVVEGAPRVLVRLLGNPDTWLQQEAALALTYIAKSQPGRAAITQAGAAPALAAMAHSNSSDVVQRAVGCIAQLAKGSHHEREAIIASDALPRLAFLSSLDHPHIQEPARAAMIMTLVGSPM